MEPPETPKRPRYFLQNSPIKSNRHLAALIAKETGPHIMKAFNAAKTREEAQNVAFILTTYVDDVVRALDPSTTPDTVPETPGSNVVIEDDGDDHGLDLPSLLGCKGKENETIFEEVQNDLAMIITDLSDDITVPCLLAWRKRFVRELANTVITLKKNNKDTFVYMTPEELIQVANFLFHKVFGTDGIKQVTGLVTACNDREASSDAVLVERARTLAGDVNRPPAFRTLIGGFGNCVNYQTKVSNAIRGFHTNNSLFKFIHQYNYMVAQTRAGDQGIINEFRQVGVRRGKGHSFTGQVQEYLRIVLQLEATTSRVDNIIQQGLLVQKIVQTFGRGVLVLLPHVVGRELQLIGSAKLSGALDTFLNTSSSDMRADLGMICKWLKKHLYCRLNNGEKITMNIIKGGTTEPFYTRLCNAKIKVDDGEEEVEDIDSIIGVDVSMLDD